MRLLMGARHHKISWKLENISYSVKMHSPVVCDLSSRLDINNGLLYNMPNCCLHSAKVTEGAELDIDAFFWGGWGGVWSWCIHLWKNCIGCPVCREMNQIQNSSSAVCATPAWMAVLLGTSLPYYHPINCHATLAPAGMYEISDEFGLAVPFLLHYLTCGIICPSKSRPRLWSISSNLY